MDHGPPNSQFPSFNQVEVQFLPNFQATTIQGFEVGNFGRDEF